MRFVVVDVWDPVVAVHMRPTTAPVIVSLFVRFTGKRIARWHLGSARIAAPWGRA